MSSSDVEMSGEESLQVSAAASPQKELRKRKRVSDSASVSPSEKSVSVSPKKSAQRGGRNPKASKVVSEDEEEEEEEEEEEVEDEEEDADDEEEEEEEGDEEEEAWEVEKIVGHKFDKGELLYHVKWVGFPKEQNTFEPVGNLSAATLKVTAYKKGLSAEALAELEGGKKKGNKRSVSPVKKVATPAAKAKSTPKSAKKTIVSDDDEEEDEEEEIAVVKKVSGAKATPASASKSRAPAAKTKSVADFFKPKAAAAKTTAAPAKKNDKKNEKETEPKKKTMTDQERLDKIMGTQLKAAKFAEGDPIGTVVEKGAAVLHTLIKYDADPEKLFAAVDELKVERARNEELDRAAGKPRGTDKSRNEVYMLSEALENAMWWYADREKKLRNPEVKTELKVEPKVAESTVSSGPLVLCEVSTLADGADGEAEKTVVPSPKKEVKDEDPTSDVEEMEEDEVIASKPAAKAVKTTSAAKKAAAKKPATSKKPASPKKTADPKKTESPKKADGPKKKVASMFTPFKCKTCPEAFSTRGELLVHNNENHS